MDVLAATRFRVRGAKGIRIQGTNKKPGMSAHAIGVAGQPRQLFLPAYLYSAEHSSKPEWSPTR